MTPLPPDGPYNVTVNKSPEGAYEAATALDAALMFAASVGAVAVEFWPEISSLIVTTDTHRHVCAVRWWGGTVP